jgi:predicted ATPase
MEYYGKAYTIKYAENKISIEDKPDGNYRLPQIMYVPSERNFLTYLRTTGNLKSEGALQDFEREYFNAANQLNGSLPLPINGFEIEYSKLHEMLYVKNGNCKIRITEAASGLQSSIPLFLVSDYLSKFNKKSFVNIVEKPEQNLFPVSQMKMIKSLVSICNRNEDGNLIVSTHSPYILATINNLIMAEKAGAKEPEKVVSRVAKDLWINHNDVFACLVENGTVTEIIDEEFDLIQQEQLDSVSRIINGEFDFLYEL